MMLLEVGCEKEVLKESKLSQIALSSSLMSAATTDECLPAAAAPVTPFMLSVKKSDDELLGTLNEEKTGHRTHKSHAKCIHK